MTAPNMITYHVMVRWLERVEGWDMAEIRHEIVAAGGEATDLDILMHLGRVYGVDTGALVARIAPVSVQLAVLSGASAINTGGWTLIIRNGCIVTIRDRRPFCHRKDWAEDTRREHAGRRGRVEAEAFA